MKQERASEPEELAPVLHAAIARRGVTLVWLKERLAERGSPVSLTTLSYWRSGRRRPEGTSSLNALEEIEDLLGLLPGELLDLVGDSRRTVPVSEPASFHSDVLLTAVQETLDELGAADVRNLRDLSATVVVDVDAQGRLRRRHTRILLQATSGTIRDIPYTDSSPEPTDLPMEIVTGAGARVSRRHDHPGGRVFGVVFELEEPLTAPDTAILDWCTELPEGFPTIREVAHGVARKNRETLIWVRFAPEAPPSWVEEFSDDGSPPIPRELAGSSVHTVRRGFGPGSFGLRWGYDDAR
ncbi:hypothetical protein [Nocardioides sp. LML1-1-1.1]|uniref:hypothetical protein n=1 Tax=Nocardioides sp. LML1-1-1.1 TaxID=3135248 RepID=UPI0034478CC9